MKFKQIIKLISMALIFILITSALIMVLPEKYIGEQVGKQISFENMNIQSVIKDAFSNIGSSFKKIVNVSNSDGNPIKLDFDSFAKGFKKDTTEILEENSVEFLELDIKPFDDVDYYRSAEGKTGESLKSVLNDIIDTHKELSYKEVWDALKEIDEDPLNQNNVILLYTGKSISKDANGTDKDGWNREHVWAKSHGDFGTSKGAGTDLHHVRPADVTVNSSRNNKNFDYSEEPHHEAQGNRHDKDSFEPRDAVKGDVARMMFYMDVRYEGEHTDPDLELVEYMNESKSPFHGKLASLLEWHKNDPVSDRERRRNNIIFEKYQGNRNPFIDHPEWVETIWDEAS